MKKVLVVDDAAFMRLTIKTLLERLGDIECFEASNGIEAFAKYKELKPDLVTMDITMTDMTGIEALKLIKQFDPKAKVVMVSALGDEAMVKESIICGATSFIVKPFKDDDVILKIKKILKI